MRHALFAATMVVLAGCAGQDTTPTVANDPNVSSGQRMYCANRERLGEYFYRECIYGSRHGQN